MGSFHNDFNKFAGTTKDREEKIEHLIENLGDIYKMRKSAMDYRAAKTGMSKGSCEITPGNRSP